jgi:hypothetical protein
LGIRLASLGSFLPPPYSFSHYGPERGEET